jgi:hypothetical protein
MHRPRLQRHLVHRRDLPNPAVNAGGAIGSS